jgi:hypothetical protein
MKLTSHSYLVSEITVNRSVPSFICIYCTGFDQCIARQELCKHNPLLDYAKMEEAVLSMPAMMSQEEMVIT